MQKKAYIIISFVQANINFILFSLLCWLGALWIASTISPAPTQTNFVDLAYAFIHGKLYLLDPIRTWNDYALYHGKFYVFFGPIPALLLVPFVLIFGLSTPQQLLMPISSIIIFVAIMRICRNLGTTLSTAWWMAIFFVFSSIYLFLSITTISAYTTQVITVLFIFLALWEFTGKKRFWIIALCVACAGMTRPIGYLSAFFFVCEMILNNTPLHMKLKKLFLLFSIIGMSVVIIAFYNVARFGSFSETGYRYESTYDLRYTVAKSYGRSSLTHLPGNIYMMLFKSPEPIFADGFSYVLKFPYIRVSEWGMGIFFTSPILIYLILLRPRTSYTLSAVLTIIILLVIPLTYYSIGLWQYGYRYALEIYPFLIILLASIFKKETPLFAKILIVYSIIFNLLFMYSIFYKYPFPI